MTLGSGSKWKFRTDVLEDAGVEASWDLNISGRVGEDDITQELIICAKDSDSKGDKVIGLSHVDLEPVRSGASQWVDIQGEIVDGDGNFAGKFLASLRYINVGSEVSAAEVDPCILSPEEQCVSDNPNVGTSTALSSDGCEEPESVVDSTAPGCLEVQHVSLWRLKNTGIVGCGVRYI